MLCMQEGSDIYKYRVRIINPRAKKESITIDWHGVTEKFETVLQLKQKLINTLSSHVPPLSVIDTFNVRYFHGRPQTKSWMVAEEDLQAMYAGARDKDVLLWCDGKDSSTGRKRKSLSRDEEDMPSSSKHSTSFATEEEELEKHVSELQEIHGDKYDYGEYKIWARMIKNRQWKDKDTPPNLPMIRGKAGRKGKTDVVDTLATAAVAIIKALQPNARPKSPVATIAHASTADGMSPGKKVQLRSQYLNQLKEIQNLRNENVLTADEFQAEKDTILQTPRELK